LPCRPKHVVTAGNISQSTVAASKYARLDSPTAADVNTQNSRLTVRHHGVVASDHRKYQNPTPIDNVCTRNRRAIRWTSSPLDALHPPRMRYGHLHGLSDQRLIRPWHWVTAVTFVAPATGLAMFIYLALDTFCAEPVSGGGEPVVVRAWHVEAVRETWRRRRPSACDRSGGPAS